MDLPEITVHYLLFLLSPVLTIASTIFVGLGVIEIINFFKNNLLTRLLKVVFAPFAGLVYLMHYMVNVFDFDFWLESFLTGGGWESLTSGDKLIIFGPIVIGILYAAVKYVIGWEQGAEMGEAGSEPEQDLENN